MKHLNKFVMLFLAISMLTSCKKDNPSDEQNQPASTQTVTLSRTTNYGEDWIYFSFKNNMELTGIDDSNYQTNSIWDIAFNHYNVRTNGGTSGLGQAAAIDMGEVVFDTVTEAPQSGYEEDSTIQIIESLNSYPPPMIITNGSPLLSEAIGVDTSSPPPTYPLNNHIYVLKTAEGKYVKIWFKSYHNTSGTSGYVTFDYNYQSDGSGSFD